jgi:hypothetical protein
MYSQIHLVNDLDKWVQIKIKGKLGSNNTDEVRKLIRTIPSDNNYSYISVPLLTQPRN